MDKKSELELTEIITRVMSEVNQEVKGNEAAFKVSDLRNHLGDLAKVGGKAAWTISYSTAASSIEKLGDLGNAAWTISYSTAASTIEKIGNLEK